MKINIILSRFFALIFVSIIFISLYISFLKINNDEIERFKIQEMRSPYEYPVLSPSTLINFPTRFEKAFNDRFGLRNQLITMYENFMYYIFNMLNSRMTQGKNGYVFLGNYSEISNVLSGYTNKKLLNDDATIIKNYEHFFNKLHVKTLIVSMPGKIQLEFENLPDYIQHKFNAPWSNLKRVQLVNILPKEFVDKYILFPVDRAIKENAVFPLFPKKNFHWTPSRYTRVIANSIAERFCIEGYSSPRNDDYIKIQCASDFSHLTKVKMINKEYEIYKPGYFEQHNVSFIDPAKRYPGLEGFLCNGSGYAENINKNGKILAIGDSFTPMLTNDLALYFSQVITMNFAYMNNFPKIDQWLTTIFKEFCPDYVVFIDNDSFLIGRYGFIDKYNKLFVTE